MDSSSKPLVEDKKSLLTRGLNSAVVPLFSPKREYITAVEKACHKLSLKVAEELRAEASRVHKGTCQPIPSITREEARA